MGLTAGATAPPGFQAGGGDSIACVAGRRTMATIEMITANTAAPTKRFLGRNQAGTPCAGTEASSRRRRDSERLLPGARTLGGRSADLGLSASSLERPRPPNSTLGRDAMLSRAQRTMSLA